MKQNWLYRKSSIKKLWIGAIILLAISVLVEFFVILHPHFKVEGFFAFHAIYGFLACVVMVLFAKLLGYFIKRRDDYYDM